MTVASDQYQCLNSCINDVNCVWFEYDSATDLCFLLEDCTTYDQGCSTCVVGNRDCEGEEEKVLLLGLGIDHLPGYPVIRRYFTVCSKKFLFYTKGRLNLTKGINLFLN